VYIYIYILAKTLHQLSNIWTFFLKLPQILNPIQVLGSIFKKTNYNHLTFEVHANKNKKIMYPKIILLSP
jgi:hypothetical protein